MALVVVEMTIALALTSAAGLLLVSLSRMMRVNLGFSSEGIETASYSLAPALLPLLEPRGGKAPQRDAAAVMATAIHERVLAEALRLPGSAAALSSDPQLVSEQGYQYVSLTPSASGDFADTTMIAGEYFRLLDIPLLAGRGFSDSDGAHAPLVAVVSRGLARYLWGDETALGRRFIVGGEPRVVVGWWQTSSPRDRFLRAD